MTRPAQPARQRRRLRGFTLIEMLVTMAIAAIVLGLGVPSFQEVIRSSRTTTVANDLVSAMTLARSEAVRRGAVVTVCASADQATCAAGAVDWADGWIVTTDTELLRSWPAAPAGATVAGPGTVSGRVMFMPVGSLSAPDLVPAGINQARLHVRMPGCTGNQARAVDINLMGRVNTRPAQPCVDAS